MTIKIKTCNPMIAKIAAAIGTRRDVTRTDLAAQFNISPSRAKILLSFARRAGLLAPYPVGGVGYWMAPAVVAQIKAEVAEAKMARERLRHRTRKAESVGASLDDGTDDWPIQRRIVAADGRPMPHTSAPRSVFDVVATC